MKKEIPPSCHVGNHFGETKWLPPINLGKKIRKNVEKGVPSHAIFVKKKKVPHPKTEGEEPRKKSKRRRKNPYLPVRRQKRRHIAWKALVERGDNQKEEKHFKNLNVTGLCDQFRIT